MVSPEVNLKLGQNGKKKKTNRKSQEMWTIDALQNFLDSSSFMASSSKTTKIPPSVFFFLSKNK